MAHELGPTPDQQRALGDLVHRGTLSTEQADAVRTALWVPGQRGAGGSPASVLIEAAAYVGGGLILGGAVLLVSLNLNDIGKAGAAAVLAGFSAVLIITAILVAGGPVATVRLRDHHAPVRRRLVGVLLAVSSGPAALAAGLNREDQAALIAGLVGLAVAIAAYALVATVPGILAMAAMSATATIGALQIPEYDALITALAFIGLGLLWAAVSAPELIVPRHVGLALAAVFCIGGAQLATGEARYWPWAYGLTVLAALGCFVVYWLEGATVLLALGVIATTVAIPEAITDWTNDSLSGPAILLTSGAVLIGASALGLWLRSRRTGLTPITAE